MRIEITRHGPEVVDELRPLWLALVRHHAEVAPEMGPVYTDDETWKRRRADYTEWLAEPDAFALVARGGGGEAVGYALVTVNPASPTWPDPPRFGLIESLSLLPEARGGGAGRALVDGVEAELRRIGVDEVRLNVMSSNAPAIAFYERVGFTSYVVGMRRRR